VGMIRGTLRSPPVLRLQCPIMTERPFEAVGLSADADRAYPLLVATRGVATAELARQMGVSAERARAACDELAVRELVRLGPDDRWYPLPPHAGLLPLLARAQEQVRAGRELLDRLGVEYQRVHEGHRAEEIVRTVEGADAIRRRMAQVCGSARDELLIFARGDGFPGVPAGVRRRVVVERADFEAGEWGAQVRVVERLPVRMCVADRSAVLLPVAADGLPSDSVMLVIAASGLLDALVLLFESVWAGAVPLGGSVTDRDALQGRILAMLVMGSTDAAMARSLGVAVRTVQRRITAMQRAAGVDNRIQLVWYAARHGWLD
jgi:DNA-binding CsgD family transcriptional regulator